MMSSLQRILRPVRSHALAGTRIAKAATKIIPAMATSMRRCNVTAAARNMSSSSSPTSSQQQPPTPDSIPEGELQVGELQGAEFRIEPLRRTGEDAATMRARLQRQSRGRGTLESELLLSTFAKAHLPTMSPAQLGQYDRFLDENDWDIYYWATQNEPTNPSGAATPAAGDKGKATAAAAAAAPSPRPGEWAQTVGTFKPAYRPVPSRWRDSEVLTLLRSHVRRRSAGGVLDGPEAGKKSGAHEGGSGGGMAFMPPLN